MSATARRMRTSSGFILPAVLFTMLVIALIASALQAAVWQSTRHARLGFAGERALHAADAAISQTLTHWDARTFASTAIGARQTSSLALNTGLDATVTLIRTSPSNAFVEAVATSANNGTPLRAQRRVSRALVMRTPALPLVGAFTALGGVTYASANNVSNSDETPTGWTTECLGVTVVDAPMAPTSNTATAQAQFDANWNRWASTAIRSDDAAAVTALAPIVTGTNCAAGTGEPLRGGAYVAACTNEWGARMLTNARPATLSVSSRHQGVLLVEGDLFVNGTLAVDGLLIVKGALDTSAGTLNVFGAVLVRDELGHGSHLGIATRVRYSQCALRRALSAVAAPSAITTRGWLERF
jgi:hypothetical protein